MEQPQDLYSRPPWAVRIRRDRLARDWSVAQAAEELIHHAREAEITQIPSKATVVRRWREWEAGEHNPDTAADDFYAPLIAKTLGTVRYAIFPQEKKRDYGGDLVIPSDQETAEILARMQRSDVDDVTLDGIARTIEILCSEYPYSPSEQLILEGRAWLKRVDGLRGHRMTLRQHREVLVQAGWLALLVGCVENDLGRRAAAESTRQMALRLGQETENTDIIGWAHEMTAWFALTDGDYYGVIAASRAGVAVAASQGVAVQLLAQEAKAWARLKDRVQMEAALDRGRQLLDRLPYPTNLDHQFVVDPSKFDFYAMDCFRILGADDIAANYAHEVIRTSTAFDGSERKPMRIAEARITLGVVAGRQGDVDEAVMLGQKALRGPRHSLPSLLMVSGELGILMAERFPKQPLARDYLDQLRELRQLA